MEPPNPGCKRRTAALSQSAVEPGATLAELPAGDNPVLAETPAGDAQRGVEIASRQQMCQRCADIVLLPPHPPHRCRLAIGQLRSRGHDLICKVRCVRAANGVFLPVIPTQLVEGEFTDGLQHGEARFALDLVVMTLA